MAAAAGGRSTRRGDWFRGGVNVRLGEHWARGRPQP